MFFKSKENRVKDAEEKEAATVHHSVDRQAPPAAATPPPVPTNTNASERTKDSRVDAKTYSRGVVQAFGAVVAVCCRSEAHRSRTLGEIEEIVRPAITSGQFLLAEATHKENGLVTPVAVVLWASVSESIDQRLSSGVTTKLQAADWKSGNNIWIVDAVGDNQVISAMVKGLREKTWNGRSVKLWEQGANGTWSTRILQPAVS